MPVPQALDAIRQKGLEAAIEKAVKDKEECTQRLQQAHEAFAFCKLQGKDENPPKKEAVQKATEAVGNEQETYASYSGIPVVLQPTHGGS